jgi:hypothetical protein
MNAVELLDGILDPLENLIALPQQVLKFGFGCLQGGLQGRLPRVPSAILRSFTLQCGGVRWDGFQARSGACGVEVRQADVGSVVPVGLEHRKNHIAIAFIGDRPPHLELGLVHL